MSYHVKHFEHLVSKVHARVILMGIAHQYYASQDIKAKWGLLRSFYMECISEIKESDHRGIDPYVLPVKFTPIERVAWSSIRLARLEFYPQFPVLNSFVDFGNPKLKIGIELDGKAFHNRVQDTERDEAMDRIGWTIYRIEGRECFRKYVDPIEDFEDFGDLTHDEKREAIKFWLSETCDGVINAIGYVHFNLPCDEETLTWAKESLDAHKLVHHDLPF